MAASTTVFVAASVIILIAGAAELWRTLREPAGPIERQQPKQPTPAGLQPAAVMAWTGVAAWALLLPAMLRDAQLSVRDDIAPVVLALGLAAQQGSYLAGRWVSPPASRAVTLCSAAAIAVVGGLTVGLAG
jgi:hypothetical protein